jgi:hypothetical protein
MPFPHVERAGRESRTGRGHTEAQNYPCGQFTQIYDFPQSFVDAMHRSANFELRECGTASGGSQKATQSAINAHLPSGPFSACRYPKAARAAIDRTELGRRIPDAVVGGAITGDSERQEAWDGHDRRHSFRY